MGIEGYRVAQIAKAEAEPWLIKKHYAHSVPFITYAYGLIDSKDTTRGVCVYNGNPAGEGVGIDFIVDVSKIPFEVGFVELCRLVVEDGHEKNLLSWFVARTLDDLRQKSPHVILSYSDAAVGHHGYIYQSLSWLYTGATAEGGWLLVDRNGQRKHRKAIWNKWGSSGVDTLERLGIKRVKKDIKHRYVTFLGSPAQRKAMRKALKLDILPYPKGENTRYNASTEVKQPTKFFVD